MSQSPAKQIRNYSPDDWDEFILEWTTGFDPAYVLTDRLDGAGDKGRDVVGYLGDPNSGCEWDNYQCKHYREPLQPNQIWIELGKLCVYTFRGDYSVPRRYRFVSPLGVGTKLHDLLRNPVKLREELVSQWGAKCEKGISETEAFPLTGPLRAYVQAFNFSIVGYAPVKDILEQHRRTRYWFLRFGEEPPARPQYEKPPDLPDAVETKYVTALLKAYEDHLKTPIGSPEDINSLPRLKKHFDRTREWFYSAESLNRFSRDQVEPGTFERLKREILDGIVDVVESDHADALIRVKKTTEKAQLVSPSESKLVRYVTPADKQGICHHLVNDDQIEWVSS
ncbi:MAG: ABC-three component system protein [Planctomycetaceae bacterium]